MGQLEIFELRRTSWPSGGEKGTQPMKKSNLKTGAGVLSMLLGLLVWAGQKLAWFGTKTVDTLTGLSLGFGAVATFA